MRFNIPVIVALVALAMYSTKPAKAGIIINFENIPQLPLQPDNFDDAGAMQTYSIPGGDTISGGVVLGNPTLLPAFMVYGSYPNLYGTTDLGDLSLRAVITLDFPAFEAVVSVTGLLFNGLTDPEDYIVAGLSGDTLITSQTFNGVPENFNQGFRMFAMSADPAKPFTHITITIANAAADGWSFFVDSIQLQTVPEPSSIVMILASALFLGLHHRKNHGRQFRD